MKKVLIFSFIYGFITLLLMYLEVFVLQKGIIFSLLSGLVITTIFTFIIGYYERSQRGGIITYAESVKFLFSVLAIGTVISFIGSFIIMKVDPSIVDYFVESTIESTRALNQQMGESPIELEEGLYKIEEDIKDKLSGTGLLINMVSNSLMKIFYALIISIFIKKEKAMN